MAERRRLLIVVNEIESFFNHRAPHAAAARDAGYEVHIAMQQAAAARARDAYGFTFHSLPLTRGLGAPWHNIAAAYALRRLLRAIRPALVHAYTLKPVLVAGLVCRSAGVPFVASITGTGSWFVATRWHEHAVRAVLLPPLRLATGKAAQVMVQNQTDAGLVHDSLRVPPPRITCTRGSGVDLSVFHPAATPAAEPVQVVLAARMIADKGISDFVAAARLLTQRGVEARFVLAGPLDPDNKRHICENTLACWQADGTVTWLGHVDDMAGLYRRAHIACLPSYYREGLPKSLLEAAACGLPVVTTDTPGCRDAVIDGQTGILVPPRDPDALAAALMPLIADAALRARLGAAGRAFMAAEFSTATVSHQTLNVYAQALAATERG